MKEPVVFINQQLEKSGYIWAEFENHSLVNKIHLKYSFNSYRFANYKTIFNKEVPSNINDFLSNLLKKEPYKGTPKILNVVKWSNISLDRIKEFASKNNIRLNKGFKGSDTIVLSRNFISRIHHIISCSEYYKYKVAQTTFGELENLEKIHNLGILKDVDVQFYVSKFKQKNLPIYFALKQGLDFGDNKNANSETYNLLKTYLNFEEVLVNTQQNLYSRSKFFDLLLYLINNPQVKIVWDHELMDFINKEGFTTEEVDFSVLESMFASNSEDNIKLALEVLSNFNFEKDYMKIAILLNQYNNNISKNNLLYSPAYKYINHYLKNRNIKVSSQWDTFINKVFPNNIEHKKLLEQYYIKMFNIFGGFPEKSGYYNYGKLNYKIKNIEFEL